MIRFFNFASNHIFGISKAWHFKFRMLINAQEYSCVHNSLILSPKGMCSRDLFEFWEISDNISLTMKDRDIVAIKRLIGNRMWLIEWLQCGANALE